MKDPAEPECGMLDKIIVGTNTGCGEVRIPTTRCLRIKRIRTFARSKGYFFLSKWPVYKDYCGSTGKRDEKYDHRADILCYDVSCHTSIILYIVNLICQL